MGTASKEPQPTLHTHNAPISHNSPWQEHLGTCLLSAPHLRAAGSRGLSAPKQETSQPAGGGHLTRGLSEDRSAQPIRIYPVAACLASVVWSLSFGLSAYPCVQRGWQPKEENECTHLAPRHPHSKEGPREWLKGGPSGWWGSEWSRGEDSAHGHKRNGGPSPSPSPNLPDWDKPPASTSHLTAPVTRQGLVRCDLIESLPLQGGGQGE